VPHFGTSNPAYFHATGENIEIKIRARDISFEKEWPARCDLRKSCIPHMTVQYTSRYVYGTGFRGHSFGLSTKARAGISIHALLHDKQRKICEFRSSKKIRVSPSKCGKSSREGLYDKEVDLSHTDNCRKISYRNSPIKKIAYRK